MTLKDNNEDQIDLARLAASGDAVAQRKVYAMMHTVIDFQTNRFCKRYCRENQRLYRCSLSKPIGNASTDSAGCEWGNASYGWMLDDLCKPQRLQKYEARGQARLFDYLYSIANSLPFYERWKDWRFDRKIRVPEYIKSIDENAAKVFYALRGQSDLLSIAQDLKLAEISVERIAREIVLSLTQRHKLYLLDSATTISLTAPENDDTQEGNTHQKDIAVEDESYEQMQNRQRLKKAWDQLDVIEQFVLEAILIDEQDANEVLEALKSLDVGLKKGVDATQTNMQQLYYFKRKALVKLGVLLDSSVGGD